MYLNMQTIEKKVIDLRECKEDVEILLPQDYDMSVTKHPNVPLKDGWEKEGLVKVIHIKSKQDTFDLVPKSVEELNNLIFVPYKTEIKCYEIEDVKALQALSTLRRIWHEWVRVLGGPTPQEYVTIHYFRVVGKIDISYNTMGILSFREAVHAKKFVECFGELLEKAKILL